MKKAPLSVTHPELAAQWHPTKNGDLTPKDVTYGSGKKVWWICPKDHAYKSSITKRTSGRNCPLCSGHHSEWLSYEEAKKTIRPLKISSMTEWKKYCKNGNKPYNIPANPEQYYKKTGEWMSWGDFLGTQYIATQHRRYIIYAKAKEFARTMKLKSRKQWNKIQLPINIPRCPDNVYDEWESWPEFLGNTKRNYNFIPYADAKKCPAKFNICTQSEWKNFSKTKSKPDNIPANPEQYYKKTGEWISWMDFLGTDRNYEFLPYFQAKVIVRDMNLKSQTEYNKISKMKGFPKNIPKDPENVYKRKGAWENWGEWLGTQTVATYLREFRSFEDARSFVRSLNISSQSEWNKYRRSGEKPDDIPSDPYDHYKNSGWISWGDWFGTGRVSNIKLHEKYVHQCHVLDDIHRKIIEKMGNTEISHKILFGIFALVDISKMRGLTKHRYCQLMRGYPHQPSFRHFRNEAMLELQRTAIIQLIETFPDELADNWKDIYQELIVYQPEGV
jgi:hypothetical protein